MKNAPVLVACLLAVAASAADNPVRPVLVGIEARNYDAMLAWYRQHFGFRLAREFLNEDADVRIAFLGNGAFELEIVADLQADRERAPLPRDRFGMPGEGFVKLALETEDLGALAASLAAAGATFVRDVRESDRKPGQSSFIVGDPDGNLIQVFGPTP